MSGDENGRVVPELWELKVLEEHAAAIMLDSLRRYQAGCVLCQRAAAAGLFDRFRGVGDDDDDKEELLDKAIVRHPAAGPLEDGGVPVVPLRREGPLWGQGGDSCA